MGQVFYGSGGCLTTMVSFQCESVMCHIIPRLIALRDNHWDDLFISLRLYRFSRRVRHVSPLQLNSVRQRRYLLWCIWNVNWQLTSQSSSFVN